MCAGATNPAGTHLLLPLPPLLLRLTLSRLARSKIEFKPLVAGQTFIRMLGYITVLRVPCSEALLFLMP